MAVLRTEGKCVHIGVGSGVACSTANGNAKAKMCGTAAGTVPALFFYAKKYYWKKTTDPKKVFIWELEDMCQAGLDVSCE